VFKGNKKGSSAKGWGTEQQEKLQNLFARWATGMIGKFAKTIEPGKPQSKRKGGKIQGGVGVKINKTWQKVRGQLKKKKTPQRSFEPDEIKKKKTWGPQKKTELTFAGSHP